MADYVGRCTLQMNQRSPMGHSFSDRTLQLTLVPWALGLAGLTFSSPALGQRVLRTIEPVDASTRFGESSCWLDDVDGDGVADYAVAGVPNPFVRIYSGASGQALVTIPAIGSGHNQDIDASLVSTGDIDGDGAGDIAHEAAGAQGLVIRLSSGATGVPIRDLDFGTTFPSIHQVDSSEDHDGDGIRDQLVAVAAGTSVRRIDLFSGASGSLLASFNPGSLFGSISIRTPAGPRVVVLGTTSTGINLQRLDILGSGTVEAQGTESFSLRGLRTAGDVDGDGWGDIIHRGRSATSGNPYVGVASGRTLNSIWLHEFTHSVGIGNPDVEQTESALDVDGDGAPDVVYSVERRIPHVTGTGLSVEIRSGVDGSLIDAWIDFQNAGSFGMSVMGVPDLDGDGSPELLIGQPRGVQNYTLQTSRGRAMILSPGATDVGEIGLEFCDIGQTNSTGTQAGLVALGSGRAADARIAFELESLPPGSFGILVVSDTPDDLPVTPIGSCLRGALGRFNAPDQIARANTLGRTSLTVALGAIPSGPTFVPVIAGSTWAFQFWHRDVAPGGHAIARYSKAVAIHFE